MLRILKYSESKKKSRGIKCRNEKKKPKIRKYNIIYDNKKIQIAMYTESQKENNWNKSVKTLAEEKG